MIQQHVFCKENNISKEAVYKKKRQYAKELEGHIITKSNKVYFDEYAEDLLKPTKYKTDLEKRYEEKRLECIALSNKATALSNTVDELKEQIYDEHLLKFDDSEKRQQELDTYLKQINIIADTCSKMNDFYVSIDKRLSSIEGNIDGMKNDIGDIRNELETIPRSKGLFKK